MKLSRRRFLQGSGLFLGTFAAGFEREAFCKAEPKRKKKLAVVTTIYRKNSHSFHIAGRFLTGYPVNGRHHIPNYEVVSMFVEQIGESDLSRGLAEKYGFEHCPTIRQALTRGSKKLAVDAVLFIGEHGDYPVNKYGQKLYPRHRLLSEIVNIFRETGKAVPVFNDKHLSYSWEKAKEIYDWSKELSFPLQAGSSLPVTWRRPEQEFPLGTGFQDAMVVAFGGPEAYGFHAFETLQCHVERRAGGETGIRSVQALAGNDVWAAGEKGIWSKELMAAAISRSRTVKPGKAKDNCPEPLAYLIEYRDGFRATILMLPDHVADFTFAAKVRGKSQPVSTLHFLPNPPGAKYFDALTYNVERMYDTGKAVIPIERTLLVSGALEKLMHSRFENSKRLETPHLKIHYQAFTDSGYFRGAVDLAGQAKGG